MLDFTAIDFETASRRQDSACQLAAVKVRDGEIVEQSMWLIRPEPCYFSDMNISIHGITPERVRDQPTFREHWTAIAAALGDDCLVAHNAGFDLGVMLACLRAQRIEVPEFQFSCTRAIARRTWPGRRGYGLKPLATWLGIRFRHHDALEDSIACARILMAARIAKQADSLESLERRLSLERGRAGAWGYRGPGKPGHRSGSRNGQFAQRPSVSRQRESVLGSSAGPAEVSTAPAEHTSEAIDLQRFLVRAEFIRPLAGKRVVFTGRFRAFSRDLEQQIATRLGGECQLQVTSTTDVLVVGSPDQRTSQAGRQQSVKEERAQQLRSAGREIAIVSEAELLEWVMSTRSTA